MKLAKLAILYCREFVKNYWPIRPLTNTAAEYEGVDREQSPGLNKGDEAGGDPGYDEGQVVNEQAVSPGTVGNPSGDDTSSRVGNTQQLQKRYSQHFIYRNEIILCEWNFKDQGNMAEKDLIYTLLAYFEEKSYSLSITCRSMLAVFLSIPISTL